MRSLRRTLAVRFTLTMFLALLLIGLWAFLGTHQRLSRQLDKSLQSALRLEAAVLAARLPIAFQSGSGDLDDFVHQVNRFVTVRDSQGRVVTTNTPFAGNLPLDPESFERAQAGELAWNTQPWAGRQIRSVYAPVPEGSRTGLAVIQVAASLEPLVDADRSIFLLMLGTVILGTACTMVGASWLARSAVAPVAEVTAQAQEITPDAVGKRITAHADLAEFKGLVGVLNNMLERLDGALQTQRRIIADLGHDLRTPLTAMRGELEVALRGERSPAEYSDVLRSCLEEVDHLSSISEAVVLLARLEASELRPEPAPMDLSRLAVDAVRRAQTRADGRTITVERLPTDSGFAWADAKMIGLALDHLLDNAIKHTPAGTHVAVTVDIEATLACVAVEDSGRGIPDEALRYLFERLYRADAARSRVAGAGLGLTIAAAIMEAHRGSITAERSELGGLKVRLCIPRRAQPTH